jgi:hypothetical protein
MAGFFARLFGLSSASTCCFVGHWCESPIVFANRIKTPLGSLVSKVKVCVDIWYSVSDDEIIIDRVKLSQGGSSLGDNAINVATMRGEAFFATSICDEHFLELAVERDLEDKKVGLRKRMLAKWRGANAGAASNSLVDALNAQLPPEEIGALISSGGRGQDIVFKYTTPNGESSTRHVTIKGVSGNSIRAIDRKDDQVKSFHIDRMTKVRRA